MGVHVMVLCAGFYIIGLAFWWSGVPDHRQRINNMGHVRHVSTYEFFVSHIQASHIIMPIRSVCHIIMCLTYPSVYSFGVMCPSSSHNHAHSFKCLTYPSAYSFSVSCSPSALHIQASHISKCLMHQESHVSNCLKSLTCPSASHIRVYGFQVYCIFECVVSKCWASKCQSV